MKKILAISLLLFSATAFAVDTDNDGMDDNWEYFYGLTVGYDDGWTDNDNDNLTSLQEYLAQTNPNKTDSDFDSVSDDMDLWPNDNTRAYDNDSDGMDDDWEYAHGLSVGVNDALVDQDGDVLNNIQEYTAKTNPNDYDSDNDDMHLGDGWEDLWPNNKLYSTDADSDGLPDRFEILNNTPFKTSPPYLDYNNASDAALDADGDTLTNVQEFNLGTDWTRIDSDGDGVNDNIDIAPLNAAYTIDTDGDGLPDEYETSKSLNPLVAETWPDLDMDNDGLTNLQEYILGTEPTGFNCVCDPWDTDNDGVIDGEDRYPLDPVEWEDSDRDGMPDNWEQEHGLNNSYGNNSDDDDDNDNLRNLYEYLSGTDPQIGDSDFDGVNDGMDIWPTDNTRAENNDHNLIPDEWETAHGLSGYGVMTLLDDTDSDNLYDWQEYEAQTNPNDDDSDNDGLNDGADQWPNNRLYNADTDSDGLPDRFEVLNNTPFKTSPPYLNYNNASDAAQDADADTLTNVQEFNLGTDWTRIDSDGDGVNDNIDIAPLNAAYTIDTDGDGLPDEYETSKSLNPLVAETWPDLDIDNDGLTNLQEYISGTEPTGFNCACNASDTDGDSIMDKADRYPLDPNEQFDWDRDGMPDNWEDNHGLYQNDNDSFDDRDGDGVTSLYEYLNGTDPQNPDSDFDDVVDGMDAWPADNTRGEDLDVDLLTDDWELAHGLPIMVTPVYISLVADEDNDGLYDWQEFAAKTNPNSLDSDRDGVSDSADQWPNNRLYNTDTDNDGLPDRFEILNHAPFKTLPPYLNYNNASDAVQDADADTLSNVQEFNLGTDWANEDSDGDGVNDNIDIAPLNAAYTIDTDGDGLPDEYEEFYGLDPYMGLPWEPVDFDDDGLTNLREYQLGTEPNCPMLVPDPMCLWGDTDKDGYMDGEDYYPLDPNEQFDWDRDGIPDNWQSEYNAYSSYADGDGDGVTNLYEYLNGTDPQNNDSDFDNVPDDMDAWPADNTRGEDVDIDLLPDDWELAHGLPIMATPVYISLAADEDNDGLYDWQEFSAKTNPNDQDSDNDGLNDGEDKWPNNRLYNTDTDSDGLPDRFELLNALPFKTNPPNLNYNNASDATQDADADTLSNVQEFNLGTDWANEDSDGDGFNDNSDIAPLNAAYTIDTDGDGLPDEYEEFYGLDSPHPHQQFDFDEDGLTDLQEYQLGTQPNCPMLVPDPLCEWHDTDRDGELDGMDRYPLDATEQFDWDRDGMPDNWEAEHNAYSSYGDGDGDGVTNLYEYLNGTDPQNDDSDFDNVVDGMDAWPVDRSRGEDADVDLLPDDWELAHGLPIMTTPVYISLAADEDNDGLYDWQEFAAKTNPNSLDSDRDGVSDGADQWPVDARYAIDSDNDGLPDAYEQAYAPPSKTSPPYLNYNNASDATQDADADTLTNVQEFNLGTDWTRIDSDGDGVNDSIDIAPLNEAYTIDTDGDGLPDEYEEFYGLDPYMGLPWEPVDFDDDGLTNLREYQLGTEPNCPMLVPDPLCEWRDTDRDGELDGMDRYPLDSMESHDTDRDGMPNNWENNYSLNTNINDSFSDGDSDGVTNLYEYLWGSNPGIMDTDGDSYNDAIDRFPANPAEHLDSDGDGVGDGSDVFPNNPVEQIDTDLDGVGNNADSDDDNDGVVDTLDAFPLDATETSDNDADGIGDNADMDDDEDGTPDISDNCPLVAGSQLDTDNDGLGNVCDSDADNDGVTNVSDKYPLNLAAALDTDNDSYPDSWNAGCDAICQSSSGLTLDNCPLNSNIDQADEDSNGIGDVCQSNGPGKIDTAFNPGLGNTVYTLVLQADGKLLAGGDFTSVYGDRVARFNSDSSRDTSFSLGATSGTVYTVAKQVDEKIVVGGTFGAFSGVLRNRIVRLNTNGSVDTSFNPGINGANGPVMASAVQADGKILIAGNFSSMNGTPRNRIARLNADGSHDTGFNPGSGASGIVRSMAIQTDNKVIVGGDFITIDSVSRNRIARLNSDGSLDNSFTGTGASGTVHAVVFQPDGKIIIVGSFGSVNGVTRNGIARLNTNGSLDTSFVSSGYTDGTIYAAAMQVDGKVIIGGSFNTVNNVARRYIARLNSNGSLDANFNPGLINTNGYVRSIVIQSDGKIILGGQFTNYGGITSNYIVRIHSGDADIDTIENAADNCTFAANTNQLDTDGDKQGDACDTDDDNDGVLDINDALPLDATESVDTDNDGIGNNADSDDDGDVMPDVWEVTNGFNPLVNDAAGDADGDGYSNYEEYKAGTNPQDANSHPLVSMKNDYNNDGIAGWIWLGDSNGNETLSQNWQLTFPLYSTNWGIPSRFYHPPFPDQANWEIMTTGDFDSDGDADIVWRHLSTDAWKIWHMQNGTRVAQINFVFDAAHEWSVVGAGDTDKDGDDDVILNNTSTGEVMIWQMQNHVITATHSVGIKAGYTLNRIGDFNKDGDVDLLFRENGTDVLVTWEIQANAFVTERALANTGTGYNPVCSGDFDADGDDDIMLINSSTLQEKWFEMENYTRTQQFGSSNTGFLFLGCADYDGDGDADTLWQRSSDDMTRVVLQANWGVTKQTVYTNPYGGANGFIYRGNSN